MCIKESILSSYYELRINPYLSAYEYQHDYPQINQETRSAISNPNVIAYLSLALESNCSLLICSEDSGASKMLLNALTNFIPRSESAIIIEKDSKTINSENILFNMHSLYGNKLGIGIYQSIKEASKIGADWIIVDEISRNEADALFASKDFGSSFISTVKTKNHGSDLVSRLISIPTQVDAKRLSGLDISVRIDTNTNTLSICEYLWLSRAEIEQGIDINGRDLLKCKEISVDSRESLLGSKVLKMYSDMTGFTMEQSVSKIV